MLFFGLLINLSKSESLLISSYFTISGFPLDDELLGLNSILSIFGGDGEFGDSSKISCSILTPKSMCSGFVDYYYSGY